MARLRFASLPCLALLSTLLPVGCADDTGLTISASGSSSSGSSGDPQSTTNVEPPTTSSPTSDPTTGPGPSSGTSSTTDPVDPSTTSTGPDPGTSTTTDPGTSTGTDGTSTSTGTSTDGTTGTSTQGETGDSSSGTSTGGPECTPGQTNCDCDQGNCEGAAVCILDKCLPAGDGSCPFEFDGECDEPAFCDPGTDPFDCCASAQDGNCEEFEQGGMCAPFSDFFDCGYCPFEDDQECDAPGLCPDGTDVNDCCAIPQDGVCDEQSQGGMCLDGTDPYDCGFCQFENDGECDVPFLCPDGTDVADCCAIPQDGVCEEESQGGLCPDGTDPYDCGFCPFEDDGFCDVPFDCPDGTDENDCCATPEDGVCEEQSQGGECPDGTDPYDCGFCPFEDDGECDVPIFCPEGSDINDCA